MGENKKFSGEGGTLHVANPISLWGPCSSNAVSI
jgi:hypothetical protein